MRPDINGQRPIGDELQCAVQLFGLIDAAGLLQVGRHVGFRVGEIDAGNLFHGREPL